MIRTIRFRPGEIRGVYRSQDRRLFGAIPRKAGNVKVVEEGPRAGLFYAELVDLSLCTLPCEEEDEARRREVLLLEMLWVRGEETARDKLLMMYPGTNVETGADGRYEIWVEYRPDDWDVFGAGATVEEAWEDAFAWLCELNGAI